MPNESVQSLRDQAYQTALRKISRRDYLSAELFAYLTGKDFPREIVEDVVQSLVAHQLVDDIKTVTQTIERDLRQRKIGRNKIREGLVLRGASEEQIDQAFNNLLVDELEQAILVLNSKPKESRIQAGRFLQSKGFDEEIIESALCRFFDND